MKKIGAVELTEAAVVIDTALREAIVRSDIADIEYTCEKLSGEKIRLRFKTKGTSLEGCRIYVTAEEADGEDQVIFYSGVSVPIGFFNREYEVVDCNAQTARMYGFRSKEKYCNNFYKLLPPVQANGTSSRRMIEEQVNMAYKNGKSNCNMMMQKLDGTLLPTWTSFVRVEHGGRHLVVGYAKGMTDIYDLLEREREARETLQNFIDTSPVGIEIWSEKAEILDCNRQVADIFGVPSKDAHLRKVIENTRLKHIEPSYFRKVLMYGGVEYKRKFTLDDNTEIACAVKLVRIRRDNETQVIAFIQNLKKDEPK